MQHLTPSTGQRSVTLNHYVAAQRASTNHGTQQSALTQKLRQNTNYVQLGGMINWLYAIGSQPFSKLAPLF